ILITSHREKLLATDELVPESNQIDGLSTLEEHRHRVKEDDVGLYVEVLGRQDLEDHVEGVVIEKNASQNGLFGIGRVGWNPSSRRTGYRSGPLYAPY